MRWSVVFTSLSFFAFLLQGCVRGPHNGSHQINGAGFAGAARIGNTRLRCTSTDGGSGRIASLCETIVVAEDGRETLASAIAPGFAFDWQMPKLNGSGSLTVDSCKVADSRLSQECSLTVPSTSSSELQFDLVITENATQAKETVSDFIVVTFGNAFSQTAALAVQTDGKMIAAGNTRAATQVLSNVALVRFEANGRLDPTFGNNGKVQVQNMDSMNVHGVALQADGKIVVAGMASNGIRLFGGLMRYRPNGAVDYSFAGNGSTNFAEGLDATFTSVLVQADGKILASGYINLGPFRTNILLARYLPNGTLDRSFNGTGYVSTHLVGGDRTLKAALQPDGKIVVYAKSYLQGINSDFVFVRYLPDGTLDLSFNETGIARIRVSESQARPGDMILQPDGKILGTGYAYKRDNGYDICVVRLLPSGALDSSFGSNGMAFPTIEERFGTANSIVVMPDNKILVGGSVTQDAPNRQITSTVIMRLLPDGSYDESFRDGGKAIVQAPFSFRDLVVAQDGTAFAGGVTELNGETQMSFYRIAD